MAANNNPYKAAAQVRKASTLASYLMSVNITAAQMSNATPREWQMAAHLAGVNAPSVESQSETIKTMEILERAVHARAQRWAI